jgi:hypothetical protein
MFPFSRDFVVGIKAIAIIATMVRGRIRVRVRVRARVRVGAAVVITTSA